MAEEEPSVSTDLSGLNLNARAASFVSDTSEMAAPNIASPGVVAVDITKQFASAVSRLEPGDLIKDGFFALFDAVGATEIMDPKMDSGFLGPGESLEDEYDVARDLLPEEVLGIMDQLLCLEMAWHMGYPLSQTLFTNVYIGGLLVPTPRTLEEADFVRDPAARERRHPMPMVLRAYCLGLLKSCSSLISHIKREVYFEEEDIVTNTYRRQLLDSISTDAVRDTIQSTRAAVHAMRNTWSPEMALALDARLELRYAFLRAIELSELRSNPEPLKTPWLQMKAVLKNIKKTHGLGVPVPACFSSKLQRQLASGMPPRPIVQMSFDEAGTRWERLFEDGMEVHDVLKYTDPQTLLNFVLQFQAKRPQPLVYIRSLLQCYIHSGELMLGSLPVRQILDDDLSIVVLPCSALLDPWNDTVESPNHPRYAVARQMDVFRQRAAPAYIALFQTWCSNRCRVRRILCHALRDWEGVQMDAEEIDNLLQVQLDERPLSYGPTTGAPADLEYSLPLSSWAYLYKLRMMEWTVQLGFELEIYQPDELAGMYWYLSYLAKRRVSHAERIKAFTLKALNEARAAAARPPPGGPPFTPAKEAAFTRSLSYLRTTMLDGAVTWELADALSCLYTVLARAGAVRGPDRPYGCDELRHEMRMRPFAGIGLPELPSFEAFAAAADQPENEADAILEYAARAVAGAKKGYETLARFGDKEAFTGCQHERWVAGTRDCLKSAIFAGIAITTAQKAVERAGDDGEVKLRAEVPTPDKGYHEWWIVPKVVIVP